MERAPRGGNELAEGEADPTGRDLGHDRDTAGFKQVAVGTVEAQDLEAGQRPRADMVAPAPDRIMTMRAGWAPFAMLAATLGSSPAGAQDAAPAMRGGRVWAKARLLHPHGQRGDRGAYRR